eukprot:PITA_03169
MELYAHLLYPFLDRTLFVVILTACCASLFPCYLCLDLQYQYCNNRSKCGVTDIQYPLGVGNRGCGHPHFQIDCVQNLTPVITIQGQNYTILRNDPDMCFVVKGEKCRFIDHPTDMLIPHQRRTDTAVIFARTNRTLFVYNCNNEGQLNNSTFLNRKCNSSVSYSLYESGNGMPGCSKAQVTVEMGLMQLVNNDTKRNESCKSCFESGGICGYHYNTSDSPAPFMCYCKDGPRTDNCHGQGCSVGGAALLVVLSLTCRLKNIKPPTGGALPRHLPGPEMGNLPIFSYEALRESTNCFHEENELGVGGFGTVYMGKLWDGRIVAIKRLYQDNSRRLDQFIIPELLLVYEFVPNGTLDDHLHGDRKSPKGLPWETRLNIAIQTAQALAFLHSLESPVFHRDVKSSNILLDENLDIKLADFGLCGLLPVDASHVTTIPQGSLGYVDPEYYQCYQLTEKSDVYSLGVVLVEIISAKIAMDISRNRKEINLANLAITKIQEGALHELVDPQLEFQVNHEVKVMISAVAELALRCLASERDERPDVKEVVAKLEKIRHLSGTSTGSGEE